MNKIQPINLLFVLFLAFDLHYLRPNSFDGKDHKPTQMSSNEREIIAKETESSKETPGSTDSGRDVLSRFLYSQRISLLFSDLPPSPSPCRMVSLSHSP